MQCNNYIYLQLDLRADLHVGEVKKMRIRGLDLQCCRALGGRDGAEGHLKPSQTAASRWRTVDGGGQPRPGVHGGRTSPASPNGPV